MQIKSRLIIAVLAAFLFLPSISAASSAVVKEEDREKPKPEFTRKGDIISAKLIPRAKSNSITIDFQMAGDGTLSAVNAFDINKALSPQINTKDFRSDLFAVEITGVVPGAQATLTVSSAFFTSSTYFWAFNETLPTPWMDTQAENIPLENKVQKFLIRIQDGGPLDSDGAANGNITLIGGPLDSFWGYVLGTLFIRFFGVFIVLGVLMIGMLFSGQIFQFIEKKSRAPQPDARPMAMPQAPPVVTKAPALRPAASAVTPEMAAAIGLALALHLKPRKIQPAENAPSRPAPSWAMDGRRQIMADRSMVFNRHKG